MALRFLGLIAIFFVQSFVFAADPFTNYQNLYNAAKTPAVWNADFSAGAFSHCEMSASSNKNQIQNILFGICSFNDGSKVFQAPCYLPASNSIRYGFVLDNSASVYGNTLQTSATDLVVSNQRGVTIAAYRRGNGVLLFKLGTADIGYGVCSK